MGDVDFGSVIAQIINFCILFFLFKKVVAKHLDKIVDERNAQLQKMQNFEEYCQTKEQELQLREKTITEEAQTKAHNLVAQAESISQRKAADLIEKAHNDVKMILEGGKRQVEKERFQMIENSRQYILGLAFKINERLLGNKSVSKELIEEELEKM